MAKRTGLGPQGFAAVQRAASIGHVSQEPIVGNPAAVSHTDPDELKTEPDNWYGFDSSRVSEAGYDPESQRLFVRFQKPQPGADEYVYEGVPQNVWRNMRRSQSAGKYINRVLNQYDYHRV